MRVLFLTWSSPGHLFPMVPTAWAFQARGDEVRVAAPEGCAEPITRAGLTAAVVGSPVDFRRLPPDPDLAVWDTDRHWPAGWSGRPELLDDARTRGLQAAAVRQLLVADAMIDDLVDLGRAWRPDLIVHDVLAYAGPVLAEVLGVPAVAHGWEVGTVLGSERQRRVGDFLPGYRRMFERHGATPRPVTRVIDPTPPGMRLGSSVPVERIPMRYVPYNGPGIVPPRPDGTRRRVCLTGGVALGKLDGTVLTRAVGDLLALTAGLDVDIVLAVGPGHRALLPELPGHVEVAEAVPFHLLLPSCAAVVHHGGAGTAMTAVRCGVPQLVVAQSPIYTEVGEHVMAGGGGVVLSGGEQSPETVAKTLDDLLADPRYRLALDRLAGELAAAPSPAEVAGVFTA